jgi:hypothetical protein
MNTLESEANKENQAPKEEGEAEVKTWNKI